MTTSVLSPKIQNDSIAVSVQPKIEAMINELSASLPDIKELTSKERRGIIARYTAVLEANFIYWMTATLISVQSEGARPHILENLHEEVSEAHPVMLRRFAIAAHAFPTDTDALAVDEDLTKVRQFLGRLSAVQSLATMAFFVGFIQKFMSYFADLATAQGSTDMEYTDVHGVCDIAHTQGLFDALSEEIEVNPLAPGLDIMEGVYLLRTLIQTIVFGHSDRATA
jgi:DNA-binding Lrp family transcriptional regulator